MAIVSLTTTKPALLTATSRLLTLERMGYQAALIAMAAIAIVLLIPPFIWHIRALNIPLITLICWLLLMDIKTFLNPTEEVVEDTPHDIESQVLAQYRNSTSDKVLCSCH